MEKWQKGADAVLNLSTAGKQRYFNKFPERKEWFEKNHPEHFGRSVSQATSSLNKVTKAKVKKQRLAAIRQAVEKRDQLKISSDAVKAMGVRRRESGEGLGGGLDTNRDIIAHARAGGTISSGGLGSLFEGDEITKKGNKFVYNGKEFNTEKDAMDAKQAAAPTAPAAAAATTEPSKDNFNPFKTPMAGTFGKIGTAYLAAKAGDFSTFSGLWDDLMKDAEAADLKGRPWPGPGKNTKDTTDWSKLSHSNKWMSQGDQYDILKQAPAGSEIDTRGNRMPFSAQTPVVDYGDSPKKKRNKNSEEEQGMYYEEETNPAKQLAQKIIEQKRIDECMPMSMEDGDNKWDYADTWAKNPIAKGSSESEDEPGEYDYEGDMAKSQLRSIAYNSKMLHDMLEDNTNLPEWVQSKITLAEDYIMTAANYMRGEMMAEEVEQMSEDQASDMQKIQSMDKGSMTGGKAELKTHLNYLKAMHAHQKKHGLDTAKTKNKIEGVSRTLVQMGEEVEQIDEVAMKTTKKVKDKIKKSITPAVAQTDDLIPQSMLPDQSVIPAGQGFGDDIPMITLKKKEKIKDKVAKALNKKKSVVMPKNPSENELPTPSMLPDVPTIPAGQGMGDDLPTYTVSADAGKTKYPAFKNPRVRKEEVDQSEEQVIQEETNAYVAAGSKFLTRTSTRLVYGDKND